MYDITASIVTYKTKLSDLEKVIKSFSSKKLKLKLYISDNSPTNELKYFFENYENIEYIFNDSNKGYGYGHNIIIDRVLKKSKYHIILNPDIYFNEGVLEGLFDYMEKNRDVGNIMPKVNYPNGEIQNLCKRNPRPIDILVRTFSPIKSLKQKINYKYEMQDMNKEKIMNVPILSGCFMFLRNEIFKSIGKFDERFFMYFEDFDYNRRIHCRYKTIYYPKVTIIHEHAKEAHKSKRMMFIALKSAVKYFNKWGWFFDKRRKKK